MPDAPSPRSGRPTFRPRFTLTLLYFACFFLLFALVFAIPELLEGARNLGPGPEELTPEELALARDTARDALRGGRLLLALGLAVVATGLGSYARVLPGLRGD